MNQPSGSWLAEEDYMKVTIEFGDDGTFDMPLEHIPKEKLSLLAQVLKDAASCLSQSGGSEDEGEAWKTS